MRLLLDTHALLWWINRHELVSARAREVISNGADEIFVSAVTPWEVAIKATIGRFIMAEPLGPFFSRALADNGFRMLPVTLDHAVAVRDLPLRDHRDPFDRMLAAQATVERLALISRDEQFDAYGVERVW